MAHILSTETYISIYIDVPTGVPFKLICFPSDTVLDIKTKIFILQDIPVHQQHLIWMSKELSDNLTLVHYGIRNGTTIKLILGMQVGLTSLEKGDHEYFIEMAHLINHLRELAELEGISPIIFDGSDTMGFFFPELESRNIDLQENIDEPLESSSNACLSTDEERARSEENRKMKEKVDYLIEKLRASKISKAKVPAIPLKNYSEELDVGKEEKLPAIGALSQQKNIPELCQHNSCCEIVTHLNDEKQPKEVFVYCSEATEKSAMGADAEPYSYSSNCTKSEITSEENGAVPKLPSIINSEKKKRKRCLQCKKKIGLSTTYMCRCGKEFCSSHRYAETHDCTYDYKAEGQQLQVKNAVTRAPKLPKI